MKPQNQNESDAEDEFWRTAKEEIQAGEEVTLSKSGHVIRVCTTLKELWQARAEFEVD